MRNTKTNTTSKKGVNFIKTITEDSECFFHKIEQENDLGIDAIIEFIKDEKPLNKSIAIQIKSGLSYYNSKNGDCRIQIGSHRSYWINYPLPVYGIVYVPDLNKGFWIDIKNYLENNKETNTIKFKGNRANQFDFENFNNIFIPKLTNNIPIISLSDTLELFESSDQNEFTLGSIVLFRRYVNERKTWQKFIDYIFNPENIEIPYNLIYYVSHIPWHPDIFYTGEHINNEIKNFVLKKIQMFDKSQVIKLLNQIDEEDNISRGTIGQSIEAIISKVNSKREILESILTDDYIDLNIKQLCTLLYGYYFKKNSLEFLNKINNNDNWIISETIEQINEYGQIELY
ncbi:DUF4365 domain-containing protein [Polaribacter sp. SA4-12]|uniref:DUF4365 domain-containing protein n=1 Tax=Polaribacter sp. SA4-12 TaxID=1312072 RepID=UPI000B3CE7BF|nr:DUF4365 domain-containing protein [Polaribacter sp. SA4-12]ARV13988.1 hypothetical protein BTO07_01980 [Polaribacter sp. SA4-12]